MCVPTKGWVIVIIVRFVTRQSIINWSGSLTMFAQWQQVDSPLTKWLYRPNSTAFFMFIHSSFGFRNEITPKYLLPVVIFSSCLRSEIAKSIHVKVFNLFFALCAPCYATWGMTTNSWPELLPLFYTKAEEKGFFAKICIRNFRDIPGIWIFCVIIHPFPSTIAIESTLIWKNIPIFFTVALYDTRHVEIRSEIQQSSKQVNVFYTTSVFFLETQKIFPCRTNQSPRMGRSMKRRHGNSILFLLRSLTVSPLWIHWKTLRSLWNVNKQRGANEIDRATLMEWEEFNSDEKDLIIDPHIEASLIEIGDDFTWISRFFFMSKAIC